MSLITVLTPFLPTVVQQNRSEGNFMFYIGFKITWYNNASLISKCCRILLKRETYCLTKAVIEYFCGKRNQFCI